MQLSLAKFDDESRKDRAALAEHNRRFLISPDFPQEQSIVETELLKTMYGVSVNGQAQHLGQIHVFVDSCGSIRKPTHEPRLEGTEWTDEASLSSRTPCLCLVGTLFRWTSYTLSCARGP